MHSFNTLGVVGAGNMGGGMGQKMATEGFAVILVDVDEARVEQGLGIIARSLGEAVERRVLTKPQADAAYGRVRGTTRFEDLAAADLVVEAVFEDRAVKRDVFSRLEDVCRPDTILATNTSSLSVAELAEGMRRPERILGLHYFYHPAKNRLVEVVAGPRTGTDVIQRSWALQERLGKTPIASRDAPGFIVNRFFVPWLIEAVRLLEEGVATPAAIDAVAKRAFEIGMGPFELMNVTGIPIALHAATRLGLAFGPLYGPPKRLAQQVAQADLWPLSDPPDTDRFDTIADRMRAVVFHVVATLVEDGIGTIEDVDIGARVGLRWRRGPFELMNDRGIDRVTALGTVCAARWKTSVPALLLKQAATRQPFEFKYVRTAVENGVATLTINRPDALNALNEAVVSQLQQSLDDMAARNDVGGIVIAGAGKAFAAGADIKFFIDRIEAGEVSQVVAFTRAGQDLLRNIAGCAKPVVARLHGLALGGGLELALACHRIVASTKATMAFPETGIGIYPGLGGTQRTTRRIGRGLARWLVFTGQMLSAEEAEAIGLIDSTVPPDQLDAAVLAALAAGRPTAATSRVPGDEHRLLAEFFERHDSETIRLGTADPAGRDRLAAAMRRTATKAPIALRIAGDLIDRGASLPLGEALELELSRVSEIFSTHDAYVGLRSVGGRPPVFEGR